MATKARTCKYKYTVNMWYLDQKKHKNYEIKTECIKFLVIDHNYEEENCMPILYAGMRLDRELLDNMILNCNDNLMMIAIFKYDDLTDEKQEIECFRKKFTYFLPNDVNKNDPLDYNDATNDEYKNNTFRQVTMGFICIDHINANKRSFKFLLKNTTIGEPVKEIMDTFSDVTMERIGDSTEIEQLLLPAQDSVNKALASLNNIRVLYDTPYRYYQDFDTTYLLSSSGREIKKPGDIYTSILLNIRDVNDIAANDVGFIINKTSKTYEVPVNYVNTQIYDNTISNKSKNTLVGMSSSGASKKSLQNTASYLTDKQKTVRLRNDNEGMLRNIQAENDNNNFFVFIQKTDLDSSLFTLNKRITIRFIDRYKEHNGDYLMYRKRECYLREDHNFILSTMIDFKKIFKG